MTYLALARKWRPKDFSSMVGQDHVVRALTNALETGRLHHAWLFTGTRGVGKTTLSRILAKSLNCEQGITASPCGQCRACLEIDEGRFVDYLEFDAASNRGVDEMARILEQAVYAPTVGRFKVFMIDEVHMLTGHAFNAMLKTLEEPPEHVKFILATTDPQKIPVTVLSRCLQFNLKQMPPAAIVPHLEYVLNQEGIAYQAQALRLIAKAAAGSMRDALSLTDQAIAYSSGNITQQAVQEMFGAIDHAYLVKFLQGLLTQDAGAIVGVADELQVRGFSYHHALENLAELLSQIALEQRLAGSVPEDEPLRESIIQLAELMPADALQLCYSVAIHARSELSLSPDEYAGFVMAGLRMLSLFEVAQIKKINVSALVEPVQTQTDEVAIEAVVVPNELDQAVSTEVASESLTEEAVHVPESSSEAMLTPLVSDVLVSSQDLSSEVGEVDGDIELVGQQYVDAETSALDSYMELAQTFDEEAFSHLMPASQLLPSADVNHLDAQSWLDLTASLPGNSVLEQVLRRSEYKRVQASTLYLRVDLSYLDWQVMQQEAEAFLSEHFQQAVKVVFEMGEVGHQTAHASEQLAQEQRIQIGKQALLDNPLVKQLQSDFGATIIQDSIRIK